MADLQISNLPALAEAGIQATDVLALADLSATETKKVTVKDLVAAAVALLDSGDIPAAKVATPFAADAVATATIQNLAVTAAKIANGTITATQITDATITGAKLVNDTVTATQIAANAITASELADDAVDTAAIAANAVTTAKIADANVTYAKLSLSDGDISGAKLTSASVTATQLATNSVTATELADNAVDTAAVANAAITGAKIASTTIAAGNIVNNTITATQIANGAIDTAQIADGAVTTAKLSGTISAGTITDGAVTTSKLADDAVTSAKLAANAVDAAALADNAVDSGAIASNAVIEAKIAANAVTNAKITDGTITAAKLNTSNIDRSLNVASGNLGINNVITAGTRSGITFNAQGLILSTVALGASDLPIATSSAVGGVSVGTGLSVNGSGVLSLSNSVTGATVSGITFSNSGQITAATALVAGDLPTATTGAKGAVQITSGGGLTVDGSGNLTTSTSGISAGTYQSITVNNKGVATAGAALTAALIPDLAATKITSGSFDAARIAADSIDGTKLSNSSTAVFQSIAQSGYPTAQFSGQILFDTVSEDAFIWDGNAWQAIITLTKGSLVFGGTYNANTSQMVATTSAGIAAGLAVGSNLPSPSSTTDGVYVVVSTSGTPSSPAPAIAFAPPDYILGVTNSAGSSWNEVDLSQTVAGQVASNITFTPYGQLSSTNVQDAMQELETEKLAVAGGTVTGEILFNNAATLKFEGATVDAFETTLGVVDPTTSDKTILLPNISGTLITNNDSNTVNSTMVDGSLVNTNLAANAAIAFTKLEDLTAAKILVGNASDEATAVTVTGDIGIDNAGLTSITAGAIVNADVNASAAIAGSKITTGTTSAVGVLQLTDSTSSTSATTAATPNAVKSAFDLATTANTTAGNAVAKSGSTMTGNLIIDNAKEIRLSEADSNGANYLGLKAPDSVTADLTWTLPDGDGSSGQFLKTDGSGNLSWGTDSTLDSTKLPLAGGTMSGAIAMGTSKITGLGDPTAAQDAATKTYVDTADALKLNLAGGTMSGALNMGSQNITNAGTVTGTFSGDLTGNVTGNASGSAATVTGAAQSAITSLGTLTGLTVDGDLQLEGDSNKDVLWDKSDGALEFADDAKLIFGANSDLSLWSDGSDSYIQTINTGTIYLGTASANNSMNISSNGVKILSDFDCDNGTLAVNVSLNTITATGELTLTGTGALGLASGTTAQRPGSPSAGMFRYNSTLGQFEGYTTTWGEIGGASGGATGGGSDKVFQENENTVTTDYSLSTNTNAMSVGNLTINNGVTITIGANQVWVVL